jgi:hypothetical protein
MVSRPGGEPLWNVPEDPRICLRACMTGNRLEQAAPGNVSTRVSLLARHADEPFTNGTMGKTSRAVISGSRPFNTAFGLPRNGENIARSSGTFQSGSPPGLATIVRRGTAGRRFFNSLLGYIVFSASDFARFVPFSYVGQVAPPPGYAIVCRSYLRKSAVSLSSLPVAPSAIALATEEGLV